jgi:hypothetical protein
MNPEWAKLRAAVEHAIQSLEKGERGGYRIHTSSAERVASAIAKHAKGPERDHAKEVETAAHKAHSQIDMPKGKPILEAALAIVRNYAPDAAAAPPS